MLLYVFSVKDDTWRQSVKVSHEAIAACVPDVLTTFWRPLWLLNRRTATLNLFVLHNKVTNYTKSHLLLFKIFQHTASSKAEPLPTFKNTKRTIWCHPLSKQNGANWLVATTGARFMNLILPKSATPRRFNHRLLCTSSLTYQHSVYYID